MNRESGSRLKFKVGDGTILRAARRTLPHAQSGQALLPTRGRHRHTNSTRYAKRRSAARCCVSISATSLDDPARAIDITTSAIRLLPRPEDPAFAAPAARRRAPPMVARSEAGVAPATSGRIRSRATCARE